MSTQIPISIDDILQSTAIGSLDKAIGNNLYGINHEQLPSAVPGNRERQGFLFFVRPQLNLQLDNIRNIRKFMPLAADRSADGKKDGNTTIHRFIRTTLDPRLMVGYNFGHNPEGSPKHIIDPISCPLTNNKMAFIPVLTNNLTNSSGWPDPIVPMFTSKQGRYNEAVSFVDGKVDNYEQYTIDCTFRNTIMDPILYMFYIWNHYASYVFEGKCVPYPDFIVDNRIDYNTRLFRVRLDRNHYRVTKIFSTGPAIPVGSSVGQFADLNIDETFSSANKDITIRFQCGGFELFDDILIYEFNKIVEMFNSDMKDDRRGFNMILIPRSISRLFQHRAYPRINPSNHVMEWWVERSLFDIRTQAFLQTLAQSDIDQIEEATKNDTTNTIIQGDIEDTEG